jgi:hypothetical protein
MLKRFFALLLVLLLLTFPTLAEEVLLYQDLDGGSTYSTLALDIQQAGTVKGLRTCFRNIGPVGRIDAYLCVTSPSVLTARILSSTRVTVYDTAMVSVSAVPNFLQTVTFQFDGATASGDWVYLEILSSETNISKMSLCTGYLYANGGLVASADSTDNQYFDGAKWVDEYRHHGSMQFDVYERTPAVADDLPTDTATVSVQDTLDANSTALLEKTAYGVMSGLAVTAQGTPDMTVAVTEGIAYTSANVRLAAAAANALAIDAADDAKDRTDIVYVSSAGVITHLAGAIEIDAVAGARSYTVATNAEADDTITIDGQTFTAVAADAGTDEFVPGADATATATALSTCIGANTTLAAIYAVTNPSNGVVTLTETSVGGGNEPGEATFTGTVEITSGTVTDSVAHAYGDYAPTVPAGGFLLAQINVDATQTTVAASDITDKRVILANQNATLIAALAGFLGTANAAPSSGTFEVNDKYFNSEPAAGEYIGWVCVTKGTMGTLNSGATTGSVESASDELVVSAKAGLVVGQYITIAGVTGVKKITAIDTVGTVTTVTLDSASDATVTDAGVAFSAAVWKGFGIIETP